MHARPLSGLAQLLARLGNQRVLRADLILCDLLENWLDEYAPIMQSFLERLLSITRLGVHTGVTKAYEVLEQIGALDNDLQDRHQQLQAFMSLLTAIMARWPIARRQETDLLLRSVLDRVLSMTALLSTHCDTLDISRSSLLASVNIRLMRGANEINVIMNRLTLFAVLSWLPIFTSGFFTMNIDVRAAADGPAVPGGCGANPHRSQLPYTFQYYDTLVPFFVFTAINVFVMVALIAWLWRKGYL